MITLTELVERASTAPSPRGTHVVLPGEPWHFAESHAADEFSIYRVHFVQERATRTILFILHNCEWKWAVINHGSPGCCGSDDLSPAAFGYRNLPLAAKACLEWLTDPEIRGPRSARPEERP